VEKAAYPVEIQKFPLNHDFCKKGLVIDRDEGNILKLDYAARVVIGYHGTRRLSDEELQETYGPQKKTEFTGSSTLRYWSMTTYFETPVVSLYANLIDHHEERKIEEGNMYFNTCRGHAEALYDAMSYNFAEYKKGWYFEQIALHTDKYILPQPNVRKWLEELRQKHKRFLFLLTNSLPEYTDVLMTFSFGDDWTSLFDLISVHAKKPQWFTEQYLYFPYTIVRRKNGEYPGPEHPLDETPAEELKFNGLFSGGNAQMMINFFKKLRFDNHGTSTDGHLHVVYFGDHLRNDVQISKTFLKWNTVAIVEELEDVEIEQSFKSPRSKQLQKGTTNSCHPSDNQYWSSFFLASNDHLTYWANEITEHSNIYVPTLERLTEFPIDHRFDAKAPASILIPSLVSQSLAKKMGLLKM